MQAAAFNPYLKTIDHEIRAGNSTEHTHRPALKTMIEALGVELGGAITAINEPKRIACGAPDIAVFRGKTPLGYVETKDSGTNLDEAERGKGPHGEQFIRYRDALPNWILTDYLRFDWFVAGEKRDSVILAEAGERGKLRLFPDSPEKLVRLFRVFLFEQAPTVATARELAVRLAGIAQLIRDAVLKSIKLESEGQWLHTWLNAFRDVLIPDLDEGGFADMFAQTLAYGLFAAKVHSGAGQTFTREVAAYNLPKTNPFLRKLFAEIVGVDLPEELAWAVDEIISLLQHAAMAEILKDFGQGEGKNDPVVHFYETFLAAYDPKIRELRGVYYTPEAVVSYLVRSVDHLLKTRFGRSNGLADEHTMILDPATGTATFLYFVVRQIHESLARQRGAWDGAQGYVSRHLLNRVFGFELLMAPYAVAHLKLGFELEQTGYTFGSEQRLGIYLTNTLEEAARKSEKLFGKWISDEADAAAEIKQTKPIMVVIGNPPYSGHSANRSWEMRDGRKALTFIGHLIQDYYQVDGKPLGERNPKWLQDDYVKFIRWGQWRIERTGQGVLAFITNHGYLDNPTFRGMRQQLMKAFDEIYVLDLHGNSKKKERAPDGSKDENVFDIQQGVAIGIFVKRNRSAGILPALKEKNAAKMAALREALQVHHAELWGLRQEKYDALFARDVATTKWKALRPDAPFYLFVPQDTGLRKEYERGWKITDAMPVGSLGITTARDDLTIAWDEQELLTRLRDFVELPAETARAKYQLGKDARDWKVSLAQKDLDDHGIDLSYVKTILYRPFDVRRTYYTGRTRGLICMPRREVMRHMLAGVNLGLCITRSIEVGRGFEHVFCSRQLIQHHTVSLKEVNYLFPLYLCSADMKEPHPAQGELGVHFPTSGGSEGRTPNFSPAFIADLENRLGSAPRSAAILAASEENNAGRMPALRETALQGALTIRDRGRLPHWEREGAIYFVTFRLADSLPQSALESIEFERKDIIKTAEQQGRELTPSEKDRLDNLYSERIEEYLDVGEGSCYLARAEVADVVADALRHFDGVRYQLLDWCIMPNHVHVVFEPFPEHALPDILHSWKSFTANRANKILKRNGEFWQREYYDHLVRDQQDLDRISWYVAENPAKAGLTDWPWVWSCSARSAGILPASEENNAAKMAALQGRMAALQPEDVFYYFYAILYSPSYRERYAEFLKTDFPRISVTANVPLFQDLCRMGEELVSFHLLESPNLDCLITRYPREGSNIVESGFPRYLGPGEPEPGAEAPLTQGRVYTTKSNTSPGFRRRCGSSMLAGIGSAKNGSRTGAAARSATMTSSIIRRLCCLFMRRSGS